MWFMLAIAVICFTIIVLFRMFIDLKRVNNQHNRLMQSDRRDYERYIQASARELPKASMPDFSKALPPQPVARYYTEDEVIRPEDIMHLQQQYSQRQMDRMIAEERYLEKKRRDRLNRNW